MTVCAHCGRENSDETRFCDDCGKPVRGSSAAGSRPVAGGKGTPSSDPPVPRASSGRICPGCKAPAAAGFLFCPTCGTRLSAGGDEDSCEKCGAPLTPTAQFCAACGTRTIEDEVEVALNTAVFAPTKMDPRFALVIIDESGTTISTHPLAGEETTIGRGEADISFPDDPFLSPIHAQLAFRDGQMHLRDLGSRNSTWWFIEDPHRLSDGDLLLVGSQIIKFRRLGYPGPHPPEADATRRMGSLVPSADIARLSQQRSDGSERDVMHLSPGRNVTIGREKGDWLFPYDPSMSGMHAQIRSEDADFVIVDAGSRNGVAMAVRGEIPLRNGSRVLVGDKLMRLETP